MKIRTLKDIPEIKNKKVILRVDFNVPLKKNGSIQDDSRIVETLPTIKFLLKNKAKLIIVSHLGRPNGEYKEEFRLTKIAKYLSKLIKKPVKKTKTVIGSDVETAIKKIKAGEIVMLENVRFEKGEEACDKKFTKALASLGEIFVMDAFGAAHRKHASTAGIADYLPAYSGFLIEKEVQHLSPLLEKKQKRPLTMIFGGAKIDTKIGVIKNFLNKADYFLIGGGLANTFLFAAGYNVGKSLYEADQKELAQEIMMECEKNKDRFVLPHDVVVADEISEKSETADIPVEDVLGDMKILDIGKWTAEKYANIIDKSGTVIWNGPLGLCEFTPFQNGSKTVAKALAKGKKLISIIGGGDTADCINRFKISEKKFTHVSTGGGACLEFLAGDKLPGIEILKK